MPASRSSAKMDTGEPILAQKVDNVEVDALVSNGPQEMLSSSQNHYMADQVSLPTVRKKSPKKKAEAGEVGLTAVLCAWIVDHQIGMSLVLPFVATYLIC